ncbi:CHAD domain-containing protein [Streptomyces sp. XD-27]|uniref:CHAD domain-containing protein n=1 Tax=Streptomyces sp. XD-27 TaxID=3062779 RepID=UPI0026F45650|nr:CHAD domain-containing protein [Streptomyces sp. XD-27]WKX71113.1 CHAD domain-containing protein [Streptomyces sp. XD-27]
MLARYLNAQAGEFLRSLRLQRESGSDVAEAAEAARQLRRSARRISGALHAYRPLTDRAWADQLRAELVWLSGTLALEHAYAARLARLRGALHRLSGAGTPAQDAYVAPPRGELDAYAEPYGPHDPYEPHELHEPHAPYEPYGLKGPATAAAGAATDTAGAAAGARSTGRGARRGVSLTAADPVVPYGGPLSADADADADTTAVWAGESSGENSGDAAPTAWPDEAGDGSPAPRTAGAAAVPGPSGDQETASAGGGAARGGGRGEAGGAAAEAGGGGAAGPGVSRPARAARGGGRGETGGAATRDGGVRGGGRSDGHGGALTVGAARAGALLERQLTLARTRAHTAALQALGSARFHAVADAVALLASDVPLDPDTAARPAAQVLPPLAELAHRRLVEAVDALPLGRAGHPYNAEALMHGLAATPAADAPPASEQQDAPWHQVRQLVRMRRYALEVLDEGPYVEWAGPVEAEPSLSVRLLAAARALERHRDASEAAAAAAAAARTPRIAPATAYALGVLHADQRHEVEAARFAFGCVWQRIAAAAATATPAPP